MTEEPESGIDDSLSTLVSSTQTTAMKERRTKRIKTWGALQTKAVDDGFTLVGPTTSKDRNMSVLPPERGR